MKTHRLSTGSLLLALCVASVGCNDADSPSDQNDDPISQESIAEVEALADAAIAAGIPGVSIAVLNGKQTVRIARGVADKETSEAMSPEHRLRMASIAKSLVASVILQLVDEEKLSLDDSVEHWLPGMLRENGDATIEQLLRLVSGVFDFGSDPRLMAPYMEGNFEYSWRPEQLVAMAAEHPANFRPGERFEYSNTNYTLLALIIEKITGDTLANVVRDRITDPLGMSASTMETTSHLTEPYAHGYLVGLADTPLDVTRISASSVFGNGNLVATALDVARFYRGLVAGDVVSQARLPAMFSVDANGPESRYAMGLYRFGDLFPCGTFIGHDGMTPGYDATGYASLDGKRAFSVAVTSSNLADKAGDKAAHAAWSKLNMAVSCM
ncbi:MAG TPA: serine hydrolase domain-containing protein [Polyangiaceae bacterium]|nr:serine hydrolase domain-containing protein [Polyangiaceae bacterium]